MRIELYGLTEEIRLLRQSIDQLIPVISNFSAITSKLDEQIKLLKMQRYSSDSWEFIPEGHYDFETLQPGEVVNLLSTRERGALVLFGAYMTSPNVYWEVKADDLVIRGKVSDLYSCGLVGFNPRSLWLSAGNGGYAVWCTPLPYIDYNNEIKVYGKNVGSSAIQYSYVLFRYRYRGD